MPAIGITGGIATGKTAFCDCLREIVPRATFFDADQAARDLAERDPEVRGLIAREFGPGIYSSSGDLNREQLRSIVFADAEKKRALEQILHPRIRRQWSLEAESHRNSTDLFFADIPLLYETGGETLCDSVVVVACSPSVQLERLVARTQLDRSAAEQMIQSQMPLTEKVRRADHIVWNNGGRDVFAAQAGLLAGFGNSRWTKRVQRRHSRNRRRWRRSCTASPGAEGIAVETTANIPTSLDLNELQTLGPVEIEKLCRDFELRVHPGRTRHHQILDIIRAALGLEISVTAEGFFDQTGDSFGVLRWPRLNFLPVPEDVGVPRALSRNFASGSAKG